MIFEKPFRKYFLKYLTKNLLVAILKNVGTESRYKTKRRENECKILLEDYGEDWFHFLGYTENKYEKPIA